MGTLIFGIIIGVAAILLGAKGFSAEGLPLTKKKKLTGATAKTVGVFCILLGVLFIAAGCGGAIISFLRAFVYR